jgi:hypothetical protein
MEYKLEQKQANLEKINPSFVSGFTYASPKALVI